MTLHIDNVTKRFGETEVIRGVSLTVEPGEIIALLGPSGCGKTTLLRMIAGLETIDGGEVRLAGQDLATVAVHERRFGMVFQDYALFPHKDVHDNVAFGLKMSGWSAVDSQRRVNEMLTLVGLSGKGDRPVHALSGGEQQRVALARSLAPKPVLMLLDEPLGALDRALREYLMLELRDILKRSSRDQISIYVTHDQTEAYAIADRVVVMNSGRIEQVSTPRDLYLWPRTNFVARFLGMDNIVAIDEAAAGNVVQTRLGSLTLAVPVGDRRSLLLRPDGASLSSVGDNVLSGRILKRSFRGRFQLITFVCDKDPAVSLTFELPAMAQLPSDGEPLTVALPASTIVPLEAS